MSESDGGDQRSPSGRERAVALQYADHDAVPRIVSSGAGEVARAIIALARSSGVPIRHEPRLVELLSKIPVGASISPESYRLVAEIISFLYFVDGDFRNSHPRLATVIAKTEEKALPSTPGEEPLELLAPGLPRE